MSKPKTYIVPNTAQPELLAYVNKMEVLVADMVERTKKYLSDIRAVVAEYQPKVDALRDKYEADQERVGAEIVERRKNSCIQLCTATGAVYDPNGIYGIETSYLRDHGIAMLSVIEKPDGEPAVEDKFAGIDPALLAPPGTKFH